MVWFNPSSDIHLHCDGACQVAWATFARELSSRPVPFYVSFLYFLAVAYALSENRPLLLQNFSQIEALNQKFYHLRIWFVHLIETVKTEWKWVSRPHFQGLWSRGHQRLFNHWAESTSPWRFLGFFPLGYFALDIMTCLIFVCYKEPSDLLLIVFCNSPEIVIEGI